MTGSRDDDIFEPSSRRMAASGLRQNNERAILTVVATRPGSSRAEIARQTGLGPQSVSRLLAELETSGLIRFGPARRGARGQPATPIYLDANGAFCIGCEIGWRHIEIVVRNMSGEILGHHRRDYAFPDATTIVEEVASLAKLMTALIPEKHRSRLIGLGLAMPGGIGRNIDLINQDVAARTAWIDFDIVGKLEAATGIAIFPLNDGNAGCWAELVSRPAPRPKSMAYFLIGTFVGAGIVAEGRLWEGPSGNSANLGSIIVTDSHGKHNFVHLIASIVALENKLAAAGQAVPTGNPMGWDWDAIELYVAEWLDEGALALAKAIANTAAVIEFNVAIISGVMPAQIVARLVGQVREQSLKLPVLTVDRPEIEMGRLGGTAPARGAATKPLYRRFFSRESDDIGDPAAG